MANVCPLCRHELEQDSAGCSWCSGATPIAEELTPRLLVPPMFDSDPDVRGIGGWLVLVLLGLVMNPLLLLYAMRTDLHWLAWPSRVLLGMRLPGLPALIAFELFENAVLLAGLVLLLVFFFRKDRRFPRSYQLWLGFSLAAKLAEYTLSLHLGMNADWDAAPQAAAHLHRRLAMSAFLGLVVAVVWIWYFQVSRRVKATFIR